MDYRNEEWNAGNVENAGNVILWLISPNIHENVDKHQGIEARIQLFKDVGQKSRKG